MFKGTLVVRDDLENTLQLRKSMQKAGGGRARCEGLQEVVVEVVNTARRYAGKLTASYLLFQSLLF